MMVNTAAEQTEVEPVKAREAFILNAIRLLQETNHREAKQGIYMAAGDMQIALHIMADAYNNPKGEGAKILTQARVNVDTDYDEANQSVLSTIFTDLTSLLSQGEILSGVYPDSSKDRVGGSTTYYFTPEFALLGS